MVEAVFYPNAPGAATMARVEPKVLFEDNHLLVIEKPAGLLSQGDASLGDSALEWGKRYIAARYNKPGAVFLGLVHRLDKPVSGVMLLARTSKAASRLSEAFRSRRTEKTYRAIVAPPPRQHTGTLRHLLVPASEGTPTRIVDAEGSGSQSAILHYSVMRTHRLGTELEINLETGRKHQIRAQLAHIGSPILGDHRYGSRSPYIPDKIALHAFRITFPHPIGGHETTFSSVPPWGQASAE